MGYFAELDDTNTVLRVISISNSVMQEPDVSFPDTEPIGQAFIRDVLGFSGTWKQTSFNGTFRGTYAGISYLYDPISDVFVPPSQPDPPTEP